MVFASQLQMDRRRGRAIRGRGGIYYSLLCCADVASARQRRPPAMQSESLEPAILVALVSGGAVHRGTEEMIQPCLTELHAISLVGQRLSSRHQRDDM